MTAEVVSNPAESIFMLIDVSSVSLSFASLFKGHICLNARVVRSIFDPLVEATIQFCQVFITPLRYSPAFRFPNENDIK